MPREKRWKEPGKSTQRGKRYILRIIIFEWAEAEAVAASVSHFSQGQIDKKPGERPRYPAIQRLMLLN